MKRFVYKKGKVLQVYCNGQYGYCYALDKDWFGPLFAIVKRVYPEPLLSAELERLKEEEHGIAYLNTSGGCNGTGPRNSYTWTSVGTIEVGAYDRLVFYYGSENSIMTIQHPDGTEEYIHGPVDLEVFENEMHKKGYIHKVLWLPDAFVELIFKDRPLRWSEHKRY
ncbi:MAG: hypothetical protein GXY61_04610 [Lentisphaerae bacterium]|jgi:hypothetical protein|nr:hypothetical protein [Lentisphaerota bacterium]